jgi:hypothetical protein
MCGKTTSKNRASPARVTSTPTSYTARSNLAWILTRSELVRAKTTAEAELRRIEGLIDAQTAHAKLRLPPGLSLRQAWESNTDTWRRSLLQLVIKKVVVHPSRKATGWYQAGDRACRINVENVENVEIQWT